MEQAMALTGARGAEQRRTAAMKDKADKQDFEARKKAQLKADIAKGFAKQEADPDFQMKRDYGLVKPMSLEEKQRIIQEAMVLFEGEPGKQGVVKRFLQKYPDATPEVIQELTAKLSKK
jgi:hypothetical protein